MGGQIIDACCTINLCAAGEICSLLSAVGGDWHVAEIVIRESLYIVKPDAEDEQDTVMEQIDLTPAVEAGLLRTCDLENDRERGLFVEFASEVDDGEAICLAIAKVRGWTLATDDRKAQRLAARLAIAVVTTPELIQRWAEASQATGEEVSIVLQRIRNSARFIPRRGSVLYRWWMEKLQRSTT